MNEVSIIIHGVRYDAVDESAYCVGCDLLDMCTSHCILNLCEYLGVNLDCVFKKSTKSFEK